MKINGHCIRVLCVFFLAIFSASSWAILAIDDAYVIPQDSPGAPINPLANDIINIVSLQPLTTASFQLQSGQGAIASSQGNVIVTPAPGFVGQLIFLYVITDITGTDSARIVIDVQANAAPHQAVTDFHHVLENDTSINFDVLANDNFSVANGVQIIAVSTSVQGATIGIDATGLSINYQPPANYTGPDSFTYDLQDQATSVVSQGAINVFVGVSPGQNPPVANASDEEQNTIDVLDQICNDTPNGVLPCTLIATLNDTEKRNLAQQISGRHAKAQSRAMRHIKNRQSTNVRSRLSEIRSQRNRVSVNNLNTVVYNKDVPLGRAFQSHINDSISGGSAGDEGIATPWGFFVNGDMSFGEGRGDNDKPQYDQDGFNITMGSDYRFGDNIVLGGALGYGQSNLDFTLNRGTQNSDSYTFSFFGNYYPTDNLYFDVLAMWVNADLDITRRIGIASFSQTIDSTTSSQQLVVASSLGYDFSFNAWQGSVFLRAEFSDLTIDAYDEQGTGAFSLQVNEQQTETLDFAFGGRLAYVFGLDNGVVIPSFSVETVEQGDEEFAIQSSFAQVSIPQTLAVDAQEGDTQYFNIGASITGVFSGGRSYYFRYEAVTGHDEYDANTYALGLRFEF